MRKLAFLHSLNWYRPNFDFPGITLVFNTSDFENFFSTDFFEEPRFFLGDFSFSIMFLIFSANGWSVTTKCTPVWHQSTLKGGLIGSELIIKHQFKLNS